MAQGGFTDDHLAAFKQSGVKRVLIAYDRDEAGNTAGELLSKRLTGEGIDCYRVHLPKNMDVNEYALQVKPAEKSLGVVIRAAEWMEEGQAPGRQRAIETQTNPLDTDTSPQTGKLITEEYHVEGPVMLFLTTTAIDIDEELLNRCVVLTIDESRDQTAAIQQRQRQARTLSGILASNESEQLIQQHQNAQRLLRPLVVVNPYAEQLAFADSRTRTRRDHEKYLTLIDSIALLHQYQREIKSADQNGVALEYIEVTKQDIALANHLAHEIIGCSLDELPPPTRSLLQSLDSLVAEKIEEKGLRQNEVRFTRREVREAAGLSNSQVNVHLDRLVELEYVYAHYGKNGQRYQYELVFDGDINKTQAQLIGLIDVEALKNTTTADKLPVSSSHLLELEANLPECFRPASGHLSASFRPSKNADNPINNSVSSDSKGNGVKKHYSDKKNKSASHDGQDAQVSRAHGCAGETRNTGTIMVSAGA